MTVAFALWSEEVKPNNPVEFTPVADIHVKNVALGDELADESGRTSLQLIYIGDDEDEEQEDEDEKPSPRYTVLCSLTPGKIDQAKVDVILERGKPFVFDTVGNNTLYISGNYIEQNLSDLPPDEDEVLPEDEEEAFRLEDVSSDVEVDADEIDVDEEEEEAPPLPVPSSPSKKTVTFAASSKQETKKRAREEEDAPAEPSKKHTKKYGKKSKVESSDDVPATQPLAEKEKSVTDGLADGEGKKKKKKKNKGDKSKL